MKKNYLRVCLQIAIFVLLSSVNIYLIYIKKQYDYIILYACAATCFIWLLLDTFLPTKFIAFIYKIVEKPMSKSFTMDNLGLSVVSLQKAHQTSQKYLPYFTLFFLIVGIVVLLII